MRPELIIFGLVDDNKPCVEIASNFFKTQMEMTKLPDLKFAYWKGKSINKPMVIRLAYAFQKGLIYKNASKLKDKKNAKGKGYRITDHLPEELAEEQRRLQQIMKQNRTLSSATQLPMQLKKGKLTIANESYKKKVTTPTVKELLDLSEDSLKNTKEMILAQSDMSTEQGSSFLTLASVATTIKEVRNQYTHLKRKYSLATHISVAYRLAGLNKAYDEDCQDDGEHVMGRRMLDQLIESNEINICVFMVRYYGGVHIGPKRFSIVKDRVNQAMQRLCDGIVNKSMLPLRCLLGNPSSKRQKQRYRKSPRKQALQKKTPPPPADSVLQCRQALSTENDNGGLTTQDSDFNTGRDTFGTISPSRETWSNSSVIVVKHRLNNTSASNLCVEMRSDYGVRWSETSMPDALKTDQARFSFDDDENQNYLKEKTTEANTGYVNSN